MPRVLKCCVPGCTDVTSSRHRFPVYEENVFNTWLARICNDKLESKHPLDIYKTYYVCGLHFLPACVVPNSKRLKHYSLPTVDLPGFKEEPSEMNSFLFPPCSHQDCQGDVMSGRSRNRLSKKHAAHCRKKAGDTFDWTRLAVPGKREFVDWVHDRAVNFEQPDVRVVAGDLEFNCHAVVLRSYSGFFSDSTAPSVVLPPAAASSAAFSAIYDWMLAGGEDARAVLNRDNIVDVLASARQLRVPALVRLCERLLADEDVFAEYAAFRVMMDAGGREGLEYVRDWMLPRVRHCFLRLVATDDYARMSADDVCRLLSSSDIAVHGELEVVFAAALWLKADWEARRPHLVPVMKCVRWGLVPARQLLALRRGYRQPELQELVSPREVQDLVADGLSYSALVSCSQPADQAGLHEVARSLGCRPYLPRASLPVDGDPMSSCRPATYREFLDAVESWRPSPAWLQLQRERRSLPLYQRPASLPASPSGAFVRGAADIADIVPVEQGDSELVQGEGPGTFQEPRRASASPSSDSTAPLSSGSLMDAASSSSSSILTAHVSTQTPFPVTEDDSDEAQCQQLARF